MADAGEDSVSGLIVGDVFTDDRKSTLVTVQAAYDFVQTELSNNGVGTFAKTTIIQNITPVQTQDPGIEVSLSYTGYFDGVNNNATPVLPVDLRRPLVLGQRQAGVLTGFTPMFPVNDGLPARIKQSYSTEWDWREEKLYMVGALMSLDIKCRYIPFLPKLTITNQNILILNSENAVGYTAAAMFSASVGGEGAGGLWDNAKEFIAQLCTQETRGQQRGNHRRQPYSIARRMGWGTRR